MYEDLHQMLMEDDEIRRYFMSLPVRAQMTIHRRNDEIRTEEELRRYADLITKR